MAKKKGKPLRCAAYAGDCVAIIPEKLDPKSAHLAILDPPYNLGKNYDAYDDRKPIDECLAWFGKRLDQVRLAMHPSGTMWVFVNDGLVSEVDVLAKFMGFHKRSRVVWYYTFGVNHAKNFTPSHTHLLRYSKSRSKFTFNPDGIRVPSSRQLKYKDKRANPKGRLPDNTWVLFPEQIPDSFDPAGDTWLASRVCGTFNEREPHSPNQIPVPIMERIVLSTSNPGDLVLDPFMGSGSAGVAAKLHGRAYVGIDVSKTCVLESEKRIAKVQT